ncbi:SAM-dependent methyltransferase [Catalinimonas alkaloidigena]|uniref:class I SAM-dependent methyltransferase n=1 Tax=Catalinimonas alkaloidigena TaxID=1075417 RepID=UPI00240764FF|nr:class I SAM-dependent methyltransferase [Catalinimonas alkaloidigena]MDF9798219.1 SAM-dependent methyltransferase [Catalinimonas alkaloidigena]
MSEFWEESFKDKKEMWGYEPADSAISTLNLFKKKGLNKILIPGFGYGRNAKIFIDQGFDVTGIEISETAIELAKKHYGNRLKVHHGSVHNMPFDRESYDGIYCYALIHLLNKSEREKLIQDCYNQLNPNGYLVFVAISKLDIRYGDGEKVGEDTFKTKHGIHLFFYDSDAVKKEFGNFGLINTEEIREPAIKVGNKPAQRFIQIICRKESKS